MNLEGFRSGKIPKECGIYVMRFSNGSYYIGSSKDLRYRFGRHKSDMKSIAQHKNIRIQRIWDKYKEVPKFYYRTCDFKDIERFEQLYIDLYYDKRECLNLSREVGRPMRRTNIVHKYDLSGNYIRSYESQVQAALENNIKTPTMISWCVTFNGKSAGGFMWSSVKVNKMEPYVLKPTNYWICEYDEFGQFVTKFHNLEQAGKFYTISPESIGQAIKKERRLKNLSSWRKYIKSEGFPQSISVTITRIIQTDKNDNLIATYGCIADAALVTNTDGRRISEAINTKKKRKDFNWYKKEYEL